MGGAEPNEVLPKVPPAIRTVGDRRWAIVQEVERKRFMSVQELKEVFDLSEVSIRRDLDYLARQGLIQRVHGGAQAVRHSVQAGLFEARALQHLDLKRAVAARVAELLQPSDRLLLDSGTTVLEVARALPDELREKGGLTIVTRSLSIASEFRESRNIRLFVLGDMYAHDYDSFVGVHVERMLEDIRVDRLVIGADGVVPGRGLTSDNVLEVNLFRQMARCADQVIVAADSTKIGANHLQTILHFDEVDTFVTNAGAPEPFLEELRERGIDVHVAPQPE